MVGANIKAYLEQNGISQSYLARKIGVQQNTLNYWLNKSTKIDVLDYDSICEALGVGLDTFTGRGNRNAPLTE